MIFELDLDGNSIDDMKEIKSLLLKAGFTQYKPYSDFMDDESYKL